MHSHARTSIINYLFFGSQLAKFRFSSAGPSSIRFRHSVILDELRFARGRIDDERLVAPVGSDVAMIVAAGKMRVLDPALLPQFSPSHASSVTFGGVERWISGQLPKTYCAMMPMV